MEFNKENLIKSPINYTGGKFRLLPKLLPYFPQNINTFYDLFCGAGNVGININANKVICNDYINYLIELFNVWKDKSIEEITKHIDDRIKEFSLSPLNETEFKNFRKYYNTYKNIEDLFILICFSFNFQIRFNNNQEYNSSFGKEASTMNNSIRANLIRFITKIKNMDISFINNDFRFLHNIELHINDFVYCDPPYSLTCGVYQDGKRGFKGWGKQDDEDLFNLLDSLHKKNVKFALSNLIECKGNSNDLLKDWASKYNINYLNMNYKTCNYQRKINDKDLEVLITNY